MENNNVKSRIELMRQRNLSRPNGENNSKEVLQKTLMKMYPNLKSDEAAKVAREVVLAPKNSKLNVDGGEIGVAQLQHQAAEAIEYYGSGVKKPEEQEKLQQQHQQFVSQCAKVLQTKFPNMKENEASRVSSEIAFAPKDGTVSVNNQPVKVEDMKFRIAESLELLHSETSSQQEYFSWFEDFARIMKNMGDGEVTVEDLKERNEWIENSYTREAEMMTCLGLYQSSAFPEARAKYDALYNKLTKMRQLRSAMKERTANRADKPKEEQKQQEEERKKKTHRHIQAAAMVASRAMWWNLPRKELQELNMFHGNDEDLAPNYEIFEDSYWNESSRREDNRRMDNSFRFDDRLKEKILSQWNDRPAATKCAAEEMLEKTQSNQPQTAMDIKERLLILSGRRPPYKQTVLGTKMDHTHAFDIKRFNELRGRG